MDITKWNSKEKLFRDTIYQYISIPQSYVNSLIDSRYMQRLKNVAQTGLHPVYNTATHDRFGHSIGVYHLGKMAYRSLAESIKQQCKQHNLEKLEELTEELKEWGNLFYIACLVHDIGHPATSHTLEFLYEDNNIDLNISQESKELKDYISEANSVDKCSLKSEVTKLLLSDGKQDKLNSSPSPHELMGVYYILQEYDKYYKKSKPYSKEEKENSIATRIIGLIKSFRDDTKNNSKEEERDVSKSIESDIAFICRMIIGEQYSIKSDATKTENSIKNCIIQLLNGSLDVDALDYVTRNSYFAGYDTSQVDTFRICSAFSARYRQGIYESVFEKKALSVMEGYEKARNFEPSWLYSHHKVVYGVDILFRSLYSKAAQLLFFYDEEEWKKAAEDIGIEYTIDGMSESFSEDFKEKIAKGMKVILDLKQQDDIPLEDRRDKLEKLWDLINRIFTLSNNSEDNIFEEAKEIINDLEIKELEDLKECLGEEEKLNRKLINVNKIRNLYATLILSPCRPFVSEKRSFYKSTDADIETLFKTIWINIKNKQANNKANSEDTESERTTEIQNLESEFLSLADEYFERKYKTSIWKSYQEYDLFLSEIAGATAISKELISQLLISLIRSGGEPQTTWSPIERDGKEKENINDIFTIKEPDEAKELLKQELRNLDHELEMPGNAQQNKIEFCEVFNAFKDMDCMIKMHQIRYKDLGDVIKIAFDEKVLKLKDVVKLPQRLNCEFPYIYLKMKGNNLSDEKKKFTESFITYCNKKKYGRKNMYSYGINIYDDSSFNEGKVFRDVVHGDIFVEKRFLNLIDTPAFQRLRRIKQLSTADFVFMNAGHTRFAHCIGTFHITKMIVAHFRKVFERLGVTCNEMEIEALYVAALLHDIGHGPFSHAFEHVSSSDRRKTHEEWSIEIIDKDKDIIEAINNNFISCNSITAEEFTKLVKYYISPSLSNETEDNILNFKTVYSSLISSQLDADRLDYLMRDSYHTGVNFGMVDIQEIIRNMQVTEYKGKFYTCIAEEGIPSVEQFLFGRYNMYNTVYYQVRKLFLEELIIKTFKFVRNEKMYGTENIIEKIVSGELGLGDYLRLDDMEITQWLMSWVVKEDLNNNNEKILALMCDSLINRRGYERVYVLKERLKDINDFKERLANKLGEHGITKEMIDEACGFIFVFRSHNAYRYITASGEQKEYSISVLRKDGAVEDITKISNLFKEYENDEKWNAEKNVVYVNFDVLELEWKDKWKNDSDNPTTITTEVKKLIDNFNLRRQIEIEEKYSVNEVVLEMLERIFEDPCYVTAEDDQVTAVTLDEYSIELIDDRKSVNKPQLDYYFDSDDYWLFKHKYSLRYRDKSDNRFKFTLKTPTNLDGYDPGSQFARFEHELEANSGAIKEALPLLMDYGNDLLSEVDCNSETIDLKLKQKLTVENRRKKFKVTKKSGAPDFLCEICLDRVKYKHNGNCAEDYQVEVELKSDYMYRVTMKFFTDKIEKIIRDIMGEVINETSSKYVKGLERLGIKS